MTEPIAQKYLMLRILWFKLKAKEFFQRYAAGLAVVALLLPGIAIGDNLKIFLTAITQPFLLVSSLKPSFLTQAACSLILVLVFSVWVKAQKTAITGGSFAAFLKTTPMPIQTVKWVDVLMVLLANHFLWVFILFGLFYSIFDESVHSIELVRYIFLNLILINIQMSWINTSSKNNLFQITTCLALLLLLILPWPLNIEWIRVVLVFCGLLYITCFPPQINTHSHMAALSLSKLSLPQNLYLQMLFKAALASTCFRLLLILFILTGSCLLSSHFSELNQGNLTPFIFATISLTAFYLSGFLLLFRDQRQTIQPFLNTLPINQSYWIKRDIWAVTLISILVHLPYFLWQLKNFGVTELLKFYGLHCILLWSSYPLRNKAKEPTFSTFIFMLVLTIFVIYNFT